MGFDINVAGEIALGFIVGLGIGGWLLKESMVSGAYEIMSHPNFRKLIAATEKMPNLNQGQGGILGWILGKLGIGGGGGGGFFGNAGGGPPPGNYERVMLEDGREALVPR